MEILMTRSITAILIILLSACQIPPGQREDSPFYRAPGGSTLILNRRLVIPPYELKVYIQAGRPARGANQAYPFCKFEVRQKQNHPQIIEPDEFQIQRSSLVRSLFVRRTSPYLLAEAGFGGSIFGGTIFERNGKPSPEVHGVRLFLYSEQQPQVYQLVCGHLQDPTIEARYLSINQIREALGDMFTLKLAP